MSLLYPLCSTILPAQARSFGVCYSGPARGLRVGYHSTIGGRSTILYHQMPGFRKRIDVADLLSMVFFLWLVGNCSGLMKSKIKYLGQRARCWSWAGPFLVSGLDVLMSCKIWTNKKVE